MSDAQKQYNDASQLHRQLDGRKACIGSIGRLYASRPTTGWPYQTMLRCCHQITLKRKPE